MEISTDNPPGVRFEGTNGWVFTGHGGAFDSEPKSLANEVIGSFPWLGEYYLLAIYARALSTEEVKQNLAAGIPSS